MSCHLLTAQLRDVTRNRFPAFQHTVQYR